MNAESELAGADGLGAESDPWLDERRELLHRLARGGYSLDAGQRLDVINLDGPATAAQVKQAAVARLREIEASR